MAKNKKTKFITKDILKSSIIGSFQKLLYRLYLEEASSTGFIMGL